MSRMDTEEDSASYTHCSETPSGKGKLDEGEAQSVERQASVEGSAAGKRKLARELFFVEPSKKVLIREGKQAVASLALALPSELAPLPKLAISDIACTKTRFAFEGRVLNKYGTYDAKFTTTDSRKDFFRRFLKCDLADEKGFGTITLVVPSEFIPGAIDKVVVDSCIRIEGATVVPRLSNDGGTADYSLQFDASTVLLKAEPFSPRLVFIPELSIQSFLQKVSLTPTLKTTIAFVIVQVDSVQKTEGTVFEQLTIADGPTALDRATLTFVSKRKSAYYQLVSEFEKGNIVPYIARNVGAWKEKSRTLSILDMTLITPLYGHRKRRELEVALNKQIADLGYGREIEGTLRVLNCNGAIVIRRCPQCTSTNVCTTASGGFCTSCGDLPSLHEVVRLVGEIAHNNFHTEVTLVGDIVDKVLQFPKPFLSLFKEDGVEARIALSEVLTAGVFFIDTKGHVIAYQAPPTPKPPVVT